MARSKAKSSPGLRVWMLTFSALLAAIVLSGLSLVDQAHQMRGLYTGLAEVQRLQDGLLEQHSRLMLERGALSSMQQVEVVAENELDMHFPEALGEVLQ